LAQIFPKWTNKIPFFIAMGSPFAALFVILFIWYFFSPWYTDVGYRPVQPVPYSHKLHVGELGLDCRYCHSSVEIAPVASLPPTEICMNCHSIVKRDSELLAAIRDSQAQARPMKWVRVHNLPDYAYFNHSAHVNVGVGCISCHGQIDQMEVVQQAKPLSMGWCLDCHRNPAPNLRPTDQVTNMEWFPSKDHAAWAAEASAQLRPPVDCSGCHR